MDRLRDRLYVSLLHLVFFSLIYACSDEAAEPVLLSSASLRTAPGQTENVIVVVIDGPRYSETWGMTDRPYIPFMSQKLAPMGTFFSNFRNQGPTYTLAGHTAIITGEYQQIDNDGTEFPRRASVFQHFLQQKGLPPHKACLITSKFKLHALADTRDSDWKGRFNPYFDCGNNGNNRSDAKTLQKAKEVLQEKKPNLMLVQFLGPDANGHENNWPGYIKSIQETDQLVYQLWAYIQQDEHYRGKTALLITNDHGRHADDHKDGFVSHGDQCESCEHISLLAIGPDFPKGVVVTEEWDQADIPATIGALLGIKVPANHGQLIAPLIQHP